MFDHRGGSVFARIADNHAGITGGVKIDVVGAGRSHTDQTEFGRCPDMLLRDTNFIGDNDPGMSNALVDLIGCGVMMKLPVLYTFLQWLQVQILRIQALQVKNNGAQD